MSSETGKFVWPPVKVDAADLGPPRDPAYWKMNPRETPAGDAAPAPPRPRPAPPPFPRWLSLVREVESLLLPATSVSLAERLAECGFRADPPDAYCPRCGQSVGPYEVRLGACPACREKRLAWRRCVRVAPYDGVIAGAIKEAKLGAFRRLARDLGRLLGAQLLPALDAAGLDRSNAVLVPVPTAFARRLTRGIDHTQELARGVRAVTGIPIARALGRRNRRPQTLVNASERARNLAGSMWLKSGVHLGAATAILIDDVRTTGATLREAARALLAGHGEGEKPVVWAAVVAVTPARERRKGVLASQP